MSETHARNLKVGVSSPQIGGMFESVLNVARPKSSSGRMAIISPFFMLLLIWTINADPTLFYYL